MAILDGKPLTFGDRRQIAIINQQQKEAELELVAEKAATNGTLKKFNVHYEVIEEDNEIVEAIDAGHAEALFWKRNKGREIENISIREM